MTTPPKARRFHGSPAESIAPHEPRADSPAPGAAAAAEVRVTRKAALPPGFGASFIGKGKVGGDRPAGATGATRATEPAEAAAASRDDADRARFMATPPSDDGFGDLRLSTAAGPTPQGGADGAAAAPAAHGGGDPSDADEDLDTKLAAIRAEQLTDRQLRIARRIAALHKIDVSCDEEAVLRLRERGIDPSHRAALGQILSEQGNQTQNENAANTPTVVPQTMPAVPPRRGTDVGPATPPPLPSREALTEERRAAEIYRIQQDIARRRRKRLAFLAMRLALFVMLPTAIAGWYYYRVATPLYETVSQFQIQMADMASSMGGGSALASSPMATNTDAVAVQSYLTSREAMLRLDEDQGFRRAFEDPSIDPIKRLEEGATNEAAYDVYNDTVKISYDPTEGMINLRVIAPSPQLSQEFSLALIDYAEGQIDQLTSRLRNDQMQGARDVYADAEAKVLAAQQRVQELQENMGVLDPLAEGSAVMGQIAQMEAEITDKRLALNQFLSNERPQQSRVNALRGEIQRLEEMIAQTRLRMTEGNDQRRSLAAITGELRIAESDLATRQGLLAAAAEQMEAARIEANKQVRYLSLSVSPVAPDEATYPKAFQNTLVAFLIFSGIYLMLSLTASILREQVST